MITDDDDSFLYTVVAFCQSANKHTHMDKVLVLPPPLDRRSVTTSPALWQSGGLCECVSQPHPPACSDPPATELHYTLSLVLTQHMPKP